MRRLALPLLVLLVACGDSSARPRLDVPPAVEESGGATSVFARGVDSFAQSAANLDSDERRAFAVGNSFFNDNWIVAPGSAAGRDGLGPLSNANSCSGCHLHDGRAAPDGTAADNPGLIIRLSVAGTDEHGGPLDDPIYGGQFQDRSIPGVPAEGTLTITYDEVPGTYADGTAYTLRMPTYHLAGPDGPLPADVLVSPRVAPAIIGMGLLEAVPDADVRAAADPDDADGDGVSGRANEVWDVATGATALGRFGWKANQPTVEQQVAGAFDGDLGISSSMFPDQPCTAARAACAAAPNGGQPEIDDAKLARVVFYSRTLGVPRRRDVDDASVTVGAKQFANLGCASCHTPTMQTGPSDIAALSEQVIHPYTDLLLHDMGPGLADGRPDFLASGSEWRTAPLWGLGLIDDVNGHTYLLHDGRARNIEEAVLWHGGEGEAAREAFVALDADERAQLLAFLESL